MALQVFGNFDVIRDLVAEANGDLPPDPNRVRVKFQTPGGVAGIITAEMNRAMYDRGIRPVHFDFNIGASAGGINGAVEAAGQAGDRATRKIYLQMADEARQAGSDKEKIAQLLHRLMDILRGNVVDGVRLKHENLPLSPTDVRVVVSNLKGQVRFVRLREQADPFKGLHATAAVPGVFPAGEHDGEAVIDGGVAHPCPIAKVLLEIARTGKKADIIVESCRTHPDNFPLAERWGFSWYVWWYLSHYGQEVRNSLYSMDDRMRNVIRMAGERASDTRDKRFRIVYIGPTPRNAHGPADYDHTRMNRAADLGYSDMEALLDNPQPQGL